MRAVSFKRWLDGRLGRRCTVQSAPASNEVADCEVPGDYDDRECQGEKKEHPRAVIEASVVLRDAKPLRIHSDPDGWRNGKS